MSEPVLEIQPLESIMEQLKNIDRQYFELNAQIKFFLETWSKSVCLYLDGYSSTIVLLLLRESMTGKETEWLSVDQIAEILLVPPSLISRSIEALRREGLIVRDTTIDHRPIGNWLVRLNLPELKKMTWAAEVPVEEQK